MEIKSLRKQLAWVNSWIYTEGASQLENNQVQLQTAIKDHKTSVWSSESKTFNENQLFRESKPHLEFLHLEDLKFDH